MPACRRFATSRPTAPKPARPIFRGAFNLVPFLSSGHVLQCRGFFRQPFLQPRDVLQQPLARELEEIKSELRVLEIELAQLFVAEREHLAISDAFERSGTPVFRREQSHFADERTWRDL